MNDALAAEQVVAYLKDLAENVCDRWEKFDKRGKMDQSADKFLRKPKGTDAQNRILSLSVGIPLVIVSIRRFKYFVIGKRAGNPLGRTHIITVHELKMQMR